MRQHLYYLVVFQLSVGMLGYPLCPSLTCAVMDTNHHIPGSWPIHSTILALFCLLHVVNSMTSDPLP